MVSSSHLFNLIIPRLKKFPRKFFLQSNQSPSCYNQSPSLFLNGGR